MHHTPSSASIWSKKSSESARLSKIWNRTLPFLHRFWPLANKRRLSEFNLIQHGEYFRVMRPLFKHSLYIVLGKLLFVWFAGKIVVEGTIDIVSICNVGGAFEIETRAAQVWGKDWKFTASASRSPFSGHLSPGPPFSHLSRCSAPSTAHSTLFQSCPQAFQSVHKHQG